MDGKNASLPKPKFETRFIEKDSLYCQICFVSCLKKHKVQSKWERVTESFKLQKNGKALTVNTTNIWLCRLE